MNQIRIILTSVGGLAAPSMIKSLKEYFNDIYIIGVDTNSDAVGFYFTDASYVVPYGSSPNYNSELLEIAKKENVSFIIPLSDEETLSLSKNREKFSSYGIMILSSEYNKCKIVFNKGKMLTFLKQYGIETPEFRIPNNCSELLQYACELSYPEKKIVLKPNFSRGARGFWILDDDYDELYGLIKDRNRQTIKLDRVYDILLKCNKFPSILLMEYLEGDDYNVDVLAKNGEVLHIIPNIRIVPKAGPVQVGMVREDKKVYNLVKRIVKVFELDYCLNIEIAYNLAKNIPMIYEINARVGAPIVINTAAGVNLLAKSIEMAMNIPIEKHVKVQETIMIRYWNEVFIKKEKFFKS